MDSNNFERMVAFRCPPALEQAMDRAAAHDFVSKSDLIRQAVLKELRQRGLMSERVA
jgi:hypothetical protein